MKGGVTPNVLNSRGSTNKSLFLNLLLDLDSYIVKYKIQGKILHFHVHYMVYYDEKIIKGMLFFKCRLRACLELEISMKYLG